MNTRSRPIGLLGDGEPLWQEWKKDRSLENRNRLFEYYFPWCRTIANKLFFKYRSNLIEYSDVVHMCSLALINTIEKFDPDLGIPYEGYAYSRLKGIVLDEVASFTEDYTRKNINLKQDYLQERLPQPDYSNNHFDSIIDATIGLAFGLFLELGIADSSITECSPQSLYETNQENKLILQLVENLGEQEKFVVKCHYFQHLSFVEIASIMNLTRARISQIHNSSILKLRKLFEDAT